MNKKFNTRSTILWIVMFALLLIAIPISINYNALKVTNVVSLLLAFLAVVFVITYRKRNKEARRKNKRAQFTANDLYWLKENIHFFNQLDKGDRTIFSDRLRLFIANNYFVNKNGNEVEREQQLCVASSAVIAFWGFPYYDYENLSQLVIGSLEDGKPNLDTQNNSFSIPIEQLESEFKKEKSLPPISYAMVTKKQESNEGFYLGNFHQELWSSLLNYHLDKGGRMDSAFYKKMKELYLKSPELLKTRNKSMYDFICKNT